FACGAECRTLPAVLLFPVLRSQSVPKCRTLDRTWQMPCLAQEKLPAQCQCCLPCQVGARPRYRHPWCRRPDLPKMLLGCCFALSYLYILHFPADIINVLAHNRLDRVGQIKSPLESRVHDRLFRIYPVSIDLEC